MILSKQVAGANDRNGDSAWAPVYYPHVVKENIALNLEREGVMPTNGYNQDHRTP